MLSSDSLSFVRFPCLVPSVFFFFFNILSSYGHHRRRPPLTTLSFLFLSKQSLPFHICRSVLIISSTFLCSFLFLFSYSSTTTAARRQPYARNKRCRTLSMTSSAVAALGNSKHWRVSLVCSLLDFILSALVTTDCPPNARALFLSLSQPIPSSYSPLVYLTFGSCCTAFSLTPSSSATTAAAAVTTSLTFATKTAPNLQHDYLANRKWLLFFFNFLFTLVLCRFAVRRSITQKVKFHKISSFLG